MPNGVFTSVSFCTGGSLRSVHAGETPRPYPIDSVDNIATLSEDTMPSLDSNRGEAPSADDPQQEPAMSIHQFDAADTAVETAHNGETMENTSQSDAVSASQNTTAVENPGPSHDCNGGEAPSADGGQQEYAAPNHQSGAAPETSKDGENVENTIQSGCLSTSQNVTETESARHILSAVPNVNSGPAEEGTRIENDPITDGPPSQSSLTLPPESDAKLETERNLEPDHEQTPESGSESESESEDNNETHKVRLTKASSRNLASKDVKLNQALGQAIVDGNDSKFDSLLRQGADIESRFDDDDDGDSDDDDDDEDEEGDRNQSTLFLAARYDKPGIAKIILDHKSDKDFLEDKMTNGWTPAHIAAQNHCIEVLRQIMEAGEKIGIKMNIVNSTNPANSTPLLLAACEGYLDIVKMLLENGADLTIASRSKGTPLHAAAYYGRKDVFTHLLGVDGAKDLVDIQDDDGWTVLHSAIWGELEVSSLLDRGANLEVTTGGDQLTPLLLAALKGRKDIVTSLLVAGSDIKAKTKVGRTVFHMAAESGSVDTLKALAIEIDRKTMVLEDAKGGTSLCSAAIGENFEAVCFLMGHEAFMPRRLEIGVSAKVNRRDIQEVEEFLTDYIDKNDITIAPKNGKPNLILHLIVHWAVFYGWESIARTCFNRQEDLCDLKTKSGEPLLHVAACNGQVGVVKLLMEKRASRTTNLINPVADVDNKKEIIIGLHFAAANGHLETLKCLLTDEYHGNQILTKSSNGETALEFAAKNGHGHVVSFLLQELKDDPSLEDIVRKKTIDEKSLLSQAAENGHQGVGRALLDVLIKHDLTKGPESIWVVLVQVARIGLENYVRLILIKERGRGNIPNTGPVGLFPDEKWTGLLWAVYYGQYEVVWWLLRRHGQAILTTSIYQNATDIVERSLTETAKLDGDEIRTRELHFRTIKDCLQRPPQVESLFDSYDPDGTPGVFRSKDKRETCEEYRATIVDFYYKAHLASFATVTQTVYETIYNKSLDEIMKGAGIDRKEPILLHRAQRLDQPTQNTTGSPDTGEDQVALAAGTQNHRVALGKKGSPTEEEVREEAGFKFRWIHVPANNVSTTPNLL